MAAKETKLGRFLRQRADMVDETRMTGIGIIVVGDYALEFATAKSGDDEYDGNLLARLLQQAAEKRRNV